jgi:hypothetical protein
MNMNTNTGMNTSSKIGTLPDKGPEAALQGNNIGFCGAGGTGKTTTMKLLHQMIGPFGYNLLPSASRGVFKQYGVETEDQQLTMTPQQRWALQRDIQLAHAHNMVERWQEKLLGDRTQLDQYVYALQYCGSHLSVKDMQWLDRLTIAALQNYGAIFYFPITNWPTLNDGMRTEAPGQRRAFDLMLRSCFEQFQVNVYTVPIASPIDRVAYIMKVLLLEGMLPHKEIRSADKTRTINTLRAAMKL